MLTLCVVQQRGWPCEFDDLLVRRFFAQNRCASYADPLFRLKSFNKPGHQVYTVGQINTYPLGIQATQVITSESLHSGFACAGLTSPFQRSYMHGGRTSCAPGGRP